MRKGDTKTSCRPIMTREDMPGVLKEIKYWSFWIGAAYMQKKRRPSEWEKIKLRLRREFNDAGYPELVPIFIKEIEKEMACWDPPESTERRPDTGA